MKLFDTNIIIYATSGIEPFVSILEESILNNEASICALSIIEYLSKATPQERLEFKKLLDIIIIFSIDKDVALQASEYKGKYTILKKRQMLVDTFIAATAKVYNLTLITNDQVGFPMKDIKIINTFSK